MHLRYEENLVVLKIDSSSFIIFNLNFQRIVLSIFGGSY